MGLTVGHIAGDFGQEDRSYDLSGGDTTLIFIGLIGFTKLSFQLTTTGLDANTATVQVQKTNDDKTAKFLDIPGAFIEFKNSPDDVDFIEIDPARNESYKLVITVDTVTTGTLDVKLTANK